MLHHYGQEANDNFRRWPDKHLSLTTLFSIVDALESVGENVHTDHDDAKINSVTLKDN